MNATALIVTVCFAQFIGQMGSTTFNGLLPVLRDEWGLTNTQGGLLSGVIFGVYALSVLVLVTATDRFQARRIYMIGVFASTVSHLGMAYVAHDFATGMIFRAIAGFGWAGTYMVGLRVLSDELEGRIRSRGVAFHAGAMGVGGSLSFFLAGEIDRWLGWRRRPSWSAPPAQQARSWSRCCSSRAASRRPPAPIRSPISGMCSATAPPWPISPVTACIPGRCSRCAPGRSRS